MAKTVEQLEKELTELKQAFESFKQNEYATHQHANTDGTNYLRKNIVLDADQTYVVGTVKLGSETGFNPTNGSQYFAILATGPQMQETTTNQFPNMQLVMRHFPDEDSRFSTLYSDSNPIVVSFANTSVTTVAGGSTVTITGYDFATDSLVNAYINIYNASGVIVETQRIVSNTSTVITINGTWLYSTAGGFFEIYSTVFLGSYLRMWQQLTVNVDSDGGIRFGPGLFAAGQSGALYMSPSDGNLYYTTPAGVTTQVN